MATFDNWAAIHAERAALAADLETVPADRWDTQSLCANWTVRDVVAHLTATAKMTPARFVGKLAGAGFKFDHMSDKNIAEERGDTAATTLAGFKAHLNDRTAPPGPLDAMVGEAVLHSEDIRRPLGLTRAYPPDVLVHVAEFYRRSNLLIGTKRRIEGLTLRATDTDWSSGSGPEVAGPMLALVLAMTGRAAGLDQLSGEGVATLRSRMPAAAVAA